MPISNVRSMRRMRLTNEAPMASTDMLRMNTARNEPDGASMAIAPPTATTARAHPRPRNRLPRLPREKRPRKSSSSCEAVSTSGAGCPSEAARASKRGRTSPATCRPQKMSTSR